MAEQEKQKITVAHLTYNYNTKKDNLPTTKPHMVEGFSKIEIPGEGPEVEEKMHLAILNKASNYGWYNIKTITPKEYENGLKWVNLANKQLHEK